MNDDVLELRASLELKESDIFDTISDLSELVEQNVPSAVRLRQVDFRLEKHLKKLHTFMSSLNIAGKVACAQWTLAAIRKDDPRGLIIYFVLDRIIRAPQKKISADEFVLYAGRCHPLIDSHEDPRATPSARKVRAEMIAKRIAENIELAQDLRTRIVALIANPMPDDLFTRTPLYDKLSNKEVLAVFVACIAHQEADWIARAFAKGQNARQSMAMSKTPDNYARTLQLADIYLKALQLHMRNKAQRINDEAPAAKNLLQSSRKKYKPRSREATSSTAKLPLT